MAEAAQLAEAAGADLVDINFGCPVRKVTKRVPARRCSSSRSARAASSARSPRPPVPVTVKMRRGLENGSRTCLSLVRYSSKAGAGSPHPLHPRSARQMYTGKADHRFTAELVELVDVPVVASG